jgi:hypothetical protein
LIGKLHPPLIRGQAESLRTKSGDLDLAGATGNHHAIAGKFAEPEEEDLA